MTSRGAFFSPVFRQKTNLLVPRFFSAVVATPGINPSLGRQPYDQSWASASPPDHPEVLARIWPKMTHTNPRRPRFKGFRGFSRVSTTQRETAENRKMPLKHPLIWK
jgi:hypothetical protein